MNPASDEREYLVWVADDEPLIRRNLRLLLESEGYQVREAANGLAAEEAFADPLASILLLDLRMPGQGGLELLRKHADQLDRLPVIVITALGGSAAAIEAIKLGAYDYITKPFELDDVLLTVRRAIKQQDLQSHVEALSRDLESAENGAPEEMIGRCPAMLDVFKTIAKVAPTNEPVLILGENGTGKELVANAVHANSSRADGPFVRVNCAALSPSLLESELFGHERGAFTGAVSQRIGRFERADQGTIFLDEIGDLEVGLQAKLLRVLQFGTFERVGSNDTLHGNARVVAATNQDLEDAVRNGRFREDLFYRLNVLTIRLPPLRERPDDIPLLIEHTLRALARKHRWPQLQVASRQLEGYTWPGNVRQLQNTLARAAILARGRVICPEHLPAFEPATERVRVPTDYEGLSLREILAQVERQVVSEALTRSHWNRSEAAKLLGVSRRALFDKIQQYGLSAG